MKRSVQLPAHGEHSEKVSVSLCGPLGAGNAVLSGLVEPLQEGRVHNPCRAHCVTVWWEACLPTRALV